jgi:hypothetical protein
MNIGLLNLEPKYKNLALEKIRLYYSQQGNNVEDYFALNHYDKVYCSSIFTFTKKTVVPQGAICGGSGFDLTTSLPPEIEVVKPHKNFGYTSRGCIRDCPFCIVRRKEGFWFAVGDLLDLWDGKTKLVYLLDNNANAYLDHIIMLCEQAIAHSITLDITQGLDHRCLTREQIAWLKKVSHTEYHFAFDDPRYLPSVKRAIDLLQEGGINRSIWYVLVGFNTTFQEDLDRLNYLKERNQNAYVQRFNQTKDRKYIPLARWANQHHIFQGMTWEQFINRPENKKYYQAIKDLDKR